MERDDDAIASENELHVDDDSADSRLKHIHRLARPPGNKALDEVPVAEYARVANDEMLTMVLIEMAEAVKPVDEIMAVPGIDVATIAPLDLASSLGHPAEPDHPQVQAAIAEAESAILKSRVTLGGLALSGEQANRMLDRGYRCLSLGYDALLIQRGVKTAFDGIKR